MNSSSEITFTLLISECVIHTPLHRDHAAFFVNFCNSVERNTKNRFQPVKPLIDGAVSEALYDWTKINNYSMAVTA